jgi:GT2 family glycosyltransferase
LTACLTSVIRHAPAGTEIIVVDDGSPAGGASAIADSFNVSWIRLARRGGFCAAANAGIAVARGRVIEILNDDTVAAAGWATAALGAFNEAAVGAVAPLVLRPSSRGAPRIDSAGDRYYVGGVAAKRGRGERLGPAYLVPCQVFGASGSCAFYRREALLRVGRFPEEFGAYFEDVDLAFRLHRAGYVIRFEPAARVYHHVASSYGRPGRRLQEQQSCNEERVFWRNVPAGFMRRAIPRHVAVLAGKALRRWGEGSLTPFLSGRLRAFSEWMELLRHRRQLEAVFPSTEAVTWQLDMGFWT